VVQGDARLVLQGVALGGLGLTGVDLEGQGLLRSDELEVAGFRAPRRAVEVLAGLDSPLARRMRRTLRLTGRAAGARSAR